MEKAWHRLLGRVGLRITGIWVCEQGTESVIEGEIDG
jgi:hypothetical protein